MNAYVHISLPRLAVAAALVGLAAVLSRLARLDLGRALAWGAVRAAVQLIAVGYVLVALFRAEHPAAVGAALAVMLLVAAATAARRVEHGPGSRALFGPALAAIGAGSVVALAPVLALVIAPHPWFAARYVVPLSGMMVANAMNVVAQVFERVFAQAHRDVELIEQALLLGATPAQATHAIRRAAVRAALLPTLNGMLTVGLVALPGMMTGQILSGTAPDQAVRYQLVVMYQLVAVAAVAGLLAARFAQGLLFEHGARLVERESSATGGEGGAPG